MKFRDIAAMALHNLWSRKLRTALNLFGVVLSCTILVMTFAGTRGANEGIQAIIGRSDDVKRFMIRSSYGDDIDVPESELRVEGEMDEERRERIRDRKRSVYINKNFQRTAITIEDLEKLRSIPHLKSAVPESRLWCTIKLDDKTSETEPVDGLTGGIRADDHRVSDRLIAGENLDTANSREALLNEFTAYQLGYRSDSDLEELVGKTIVVEYRLGSDDSMRALEFLASVATNKNLQQKAKLLFAIKSLIDDLDSTNLSESDKRLLRETFAGSFDSPSPDKDSTESSDANKKPKKKLPPDATVNKKGEIVLAEKYTVRGIVRDQDGNDMFSFLNVIYNDSGGQVSVDHRMMEELQQHEQSFAGYWGVVGEVDDVRNLREVVDAVEKAGYGTNSAVRIFERIDEEIGNARLGISVLALLILFIAAVGISNTMIIAVLERTPEFGIMKSLGARDSNVLWLMLMEGVMTGLLGAVVALLVSFGIAWGIGKLVRNHVESRLRESFDEQIFIYSLSDLLIVFGIAVFVCTVASLLPAWRAARLDPVVAMRRS